LDRLDLELDLSRLDLFDVGVCCAALVDFVLAGVVVTGTVDALTLVFVVLLAVFAAGVLLIFSFLFELSDDVEETLTLDSESSEMLFIAALSTSGNENSTSSLGNAIISFSF
jgi:hypothetical protein